MRGRRSTGAPRCLPGGQIVADGRQRAPEPVIVPDSELTRTEQICAWVEARIADRSLRPGARLPSIRRFADEQGVSRFTVVEAYERLVARGVLDARRGAGFFVRAGAADAPRPRAPAWADLPNPRMDVVWLLRNMFRKLPSEQMPGAGVLPAGWLDPVLIAGAARAVARANLSPLLDYGEPQGFEPLRRRIAQKLAAVGVEVGPESVLTTSGVTQGLDLLTQSLMRAGDTVLVDEPSWFLMFGRFAQYGVHVVGVPREVDGPDIGRLRDLARSHRPRAFVVVGAVHNPTGSSMSLARAHQVLKLAAEFDFAVIEDDVCGDFQVASDRQDGVRLAALDGFERVIHLGGFSKTLAANLRVGFVAATPDRIRELTDLKMLLGLTSPELGERVVHRVLSEGSYRRHLEGLRARLDRVRAPMLRDLERLGLKVFGAPRAGMFVWADTGVDTGELARAMLEQGFLMAPGSLFLPDQRPSTWLRFNIATSRHPEMLDRLGKALAAGVRTPGR